MNNLALEAGDAATWVSSAIALLAVAFTIWQQWRQGRMQAQADAIARGQLEAAERRALAVEEGLQRLLEQLPRSFQAQAQIAGTPVHETDTVSWHLERLSKNQLVLRNTGTETATGVRVDVGGHPAGLTRRVPQDGVVRAGESLEFLVIGAWQHPVPREIRVWCEGRDEPDIIPVPHWG